MRNKLLLNAVVASTTASVGNVEDFNEVVVAVAGDATASFVVKFLGSIGKSSGGSDQTPDEATPDFTVAQSATNHWDEVAFYLLDDPTTVVVGSVGDTVAGGTVPLNCRLYNVNVSLVRHLAIQATRTAGTLSAWIVAAKS